MSASALVESLVDRGVMLQIDGERLTFSAPRGVLTPADREHLRAEKTAVIEIVQSNQQEELFKDIQEQAGRAANFRRAGIEAAAKNSPSASASK